MARRDAKSTAADLARLFNRSWYWAEARYMGRVAFKVDELFTVCDWLDIDVADLYNPPVTAAQQVRDAS